MTRFLSFVCLVLFLLAFQLAWLTVLPVYLCLWPYLKCVKKIRFSYIFSNISLFSILLGQRYTYLNPDMRDQVRQQKSCFLLSNHRSWGDFLACMASTDLANTGFVSRYAVICILPFSFLFALLFTRNSIFFHCSKSP